MSRSRQLDYGVTPEQQAINVARFERTARIERNRRTEIADRLNWRDQQINRGVPPTDLPSESAIKQGINPNDWGDRVDRVNRFHPPATKTSVNPAVTKSPVEAAADAHGGERTGMDQPRLTGAGVTAVVPSESGPRTVSVSPNAGQAMSLATGGKWDNMSTAERTAHLRQITGQVAPTQYSGSISQPGDAERIAGKYAGNTEPPSDRDVAGNRIGVGHDTPANTYEPGPPTDRDAAGNRVNGRAPIISSERQAGRDVRAAVESVLPGGKTAFAPRVPGTRGEMTYQDQPPQDAIREFVGGAIEGRKTEAGVSNSQAAQFEQPTEENPTPGTETSPEKDIDKTAQAVAVDDEEWKNDRESFDGFY